MLRLYCFLRFKVNCFFSFLRCKIASFLPAYTSLGSTLSNDSCGGAVVRGNALIQGFFQLIGRTIDHKVQLLLDPPVKPLNLTPSLRMGGCAKGVFYTVLVQDTLRETSRRSRSVTRGLSDYLCYTLSWTVDVVQ